MPSSKQTILDRIRRHSFDEIELPTLHGDWTKYEDPRAQFVETLAGVGGECVVVGNAAEAGEHLQSIPQYADARHTLSVVDGVGTGTVSLEDIDDPHDLENLDFAVLPGHVAVAENAAVWVTDTGLRHRVSYYIPQHIALVVPAGNLVCNLHEAYDWLAANGHFPEGKGFGCWISGPSKTADIEQSLVIGAHGARTLTVFLVDGGSKG